MCPACASTGILSVTAIVAGGGSLASLVLLLIRQVRALGPAPFKPEQLASGKAEYNYEKSEFPGDEAPGASVFFRDDDLSIYHTYSTYARGLEELIGTYHLLDLVPKGRNEENEPDYPMSWVRHHDRY